MRSITRRSALMAGGTVAAGFIARNSHAERLPDLGAALQRTDPPVVPPEITFTGADGTPHKLAEFLGHGMVINLWATWCQPCVAEMPSLAALSKALAPDDIAVLPLSSDRGGADVVRSFYQQHEISGLPVLLDPKGAAARAWRARGIPTSLIIDRKGQERGRIEGSADWSSKASVELVKRLVAL